MVALTLVLSLLGCSGGAGPAPECVDNGDCGDMQACLTSDGDPAHAKCTAVDCLQSTQCSLHQFCDSTKASKDAPTPTYTCKNGCNNDADCQAGESCNLDKHQCKAYGCRSTDLDCATGEKCKDGTCEKDDRDHCGTCDPLYGTGCTGNSTCYLWDEAGTTAYCLVQCDPSNANACPRGFECSDASGLGDYVCYADCAELQKNGWLN